MKKQKTHLFSFGEFNKKHLILFFFAPISFILILKKNEYYDNKGKKVTESIQTFTNYLGYILIQGSIYLFICIKRLIKQNKIKDISIDKTIDETLIILIILMIISDLSFSVLIILLSKFNISLFKFRYFEIFFLWIFSIIVLKVKIERHHLLTIIIMIIGIVFLTIIFLPPLKYNYLKTYILSFGLILFHFINSIHFIIGHIIFYELEFNYYLGLLILGVIGVFFILIISFISFLMKFNRITLFQDFENFLKNNNIYDLIIYIIINSFIEGIYFSFIWLIFKLFKPWFYGTTIIVNTIIFRIINILTKNNKTKFHLYEIFIYIILILTTFIFNEQIICNFWGLNIDTKKEIINRSEKDTYNLLKYETNSSDNESIG